MLRDVMWAGAGGAGRGRGRRELEGPLNFIYFPQGSGSLVGPGKLSLGELLQARFRRDSSSKWIARAPAAIAGIAAAILGGIDLQRS